MIRLFENDKKYICKLDLIAADPVMTASDLGGWMVELDGEPVEVLSETNGAIGEYRVEPWWCEEAKR